MVEKCKILISVNTINKYAIFLVIQKFGGITFVLHLILELLHDAVSLKCRFHFLAFTCVQNCVLHNSVIARSNDAYSRSTISSANP